MTIGDYVYHQRNELTPAQVTRLIRMYTVHLHNPSFPTVLLQLCGKVMFILIEVIVAKESSQNAARILNTMLETCVDKVETMVLVQDEIAARLERTKKGGATAKTVDASFIETAKPVGAAAYAVERPEDFFKGRSQSDRRSWVMS
jgi:transformation/transcription domain-associated protein